MQDARRGLSELLYSLTDLKSEEGPGVLAEKEQAPRCIPLPLPLPPPGKERKSNQAVHNIGDETKIINDGRDVITICKM